MIRPVSTSTEYAPPTTVTLVAVQFGAVCGVGVMAQSRTEVSSSPISGSDVSSLASGLMV